MHPNLKFERIATFVFIFHIALGVFNNLLTKHYLKAAEYIITEGYARKFFNIGKFLVCFVPKGEPSFAVTAHSKNVRFSNQK